MKEVCEDDLKLSWCLLEDVVSSKGKQLVGPVQRAALYTQQRWETHDCQSSDSKTMTGNKNI